MTIPQTPPDTDLPEIPGEQDPSIEPPGPAIPDDQPIEEPGIRAPGSDEPPVTIPQDEPGVAV
jgi:hypothetical protein